MNIYEYNGKYYTEDSNGDMAEIVNYVPPKKRNIIQKYWFSLTWLLYRRKKYLSYF